MVAHAAHIPSSQKVTEEMVKFMTELRKVCRMFAAHFESAQRVKPPSSLHREHLCSMAMQHVKIGVVGGSDLHKITEQLGDEGVAALNKHVPTQHLLQPAYAWECVCLSSMTDVPLLCCCMYSRV